MQALSTLRAPVDAFFQDVTVNAPDPKLRENRLLCSTRCAPRRGRWRSSRRSRGETVLSDGRRGARPQRSTSVQPAGPPPASRGAPVPGRDAPRPGGRRRDRRRAASVSGTARIAGDAGRLQDRDPADAEAARARREPEALHRPDHRIGQRLRHASPGRGRGRSRWRRRRTTARCTGASSQAGELQGPVAARRGPRRSPRPRRRCSGSKLATTAARRAGRRRARSARAGCCRPTAPGAPPPGRRAAAASSTGSGRKRRTSRRHANSVVERLRRKPSSKAGGPMIRLAHSLHTAAVAIRQERRRKKAARRGGLKSLGLETSECRILGSRPATEGWGAGFRPPAGQDPARFRQLLCQLQRGPGKA